VYNSSYEQSKKSTISKEIFKLFINENTYSQTHLIPEVKRYFSELKFFNCDSYIGLAGLTGTLLPSLQILRTKYVPVNMLTSLIKSTNGYLTEINISHT
jgi:hypothetical protein